MRIPNQSLGVNRKQYISHKIKGTIYPSRPVSQFDFRSACNSCSISHCCCDYTRDDETGVSTCACSTKEGIECFEDKLGKIENEPTALVVIVPTAPDTGHIITVPGIAANPFITEAISRRSFTSFQL